MLNVRVDYAPENDSYRLFVDAENGDKMLQFSLEDFLEFGECVEAYASYAHLNKLKADKLTSHVKTLKEALDTHEDVVRNLRASIIKAEAWLVDYTNGEYKA